MAEIKFSPDQKKCIDYRNRNILVSAAAGSGKTAVLVERIVNMVCDEENPCDIDQVLIVTFTNAAAAEMRERISKRLNELAAKNPASEHLEKQLTLVHSAQITTIDSFSLFIVKNHFNKIGLDPAFRVCDEGELKLMRRDVLAELMEDWFAKDDDAFKRCVEFFCHSGKESLLEDYILNLSKFASSFPWPKDYLLERKSDYDFKSIEEFCTTECGKYLSVHLGLLVASLRDKLKEARNICERPAGPYMYGELIDSELEALDAVAAESELDKLCNKLYAVVFDRLPSKKDDSVNADLREQAKAIRDSVKKSIDDIKKKFFDTPFDMSIEQSLECSEPLKMLIELVLEFDERMSLKKRQKKVIDFNDMEHFALDILLEKDESGKVVPSDVALEYRQHFKEIMIDEYQDSNLVQEYLLKAISGEEDGNYNRFMVGDVKQSIYRFRLANPQLFMEKFATYSPDDEHTCRIDLSQNFRSRGEVLECVNDIFKSVMTKRIGGVDYDESQQLNLGATYPEYNACQGELLVVALDEKTDKAGNIEAEGRLIAGKIKELIKNQLVTDKDTKEQRPAKYSDIAILLRTLKDYDEGIKDVLLREGIPVYAESKTGYFQAREIQELLQFLRVLDNPRQDIPLFGALCGSFGGFEEGFVAQIRTAYRDLSLYDALKDYMASDEYEGEELASFFQKIENYRRDSKCLTIRELLQEILDDTGYLDYVTAMPAGEKRRGNVLMLLTKAADFENTSYYGLFHFIRYIEQLEDYDIDYGEAIMVDENADVVKIMSIHKSKGLEFPIVFVAGMNKAFNTNETKSMLVMDMNLGLGIDYVNPVSRIKNRTLRRNAILKKMQEEELSEELRILYVALTRPKEKLIMTAAIADEESFNAEYDNSAPGHHLSYFEFISAGCFLDFLMPVIKNTKIKPVILKSSELVAKEISDEIENMVDVYRLGDSELLADPVLLADLKSKFEYEYPRKDLENLFTKTTVSELKIAAMADRDEAAFHTFEEKELVPYIPRFRKEEEKVSGTVRGNAYHRLMELIDFDAVLAFKAGNNSDSYEEYRDNLDVKEIRKKLAAFIESQTACLKLSKEYADILKLDKICNFLLSRVAFRMWKAAGRGELFKEQPFVYEIPATRLASDYSDKEKVLIQGIIDVFFVEDGKIVVLDYKTDKIESMDALWKRYETQLDYYGEALSNILNRAISEKILYSFYLEQENGIIS